MGCSIDLYSYDYEKLINKVMEVCKTEDRELVEKILQTCGNKIADRYIILNQEFWDNCSCYYNVAIIFEKFFNVDDVFDEVFCTYENNDTDRKELISAIDMYEIADALEIKIPEEEE